MPSSDQTNQTDPRDAPAEGGRDHAERSSRPRRFVAIGAAVVVVIFAGVAGLATFSDGSAARRAAAIAEAADRLASRPSADDQLSAYAKASAAMYALMKDHPFAWQTIELRLGLPVGGLTYGEVRRHIADYRKQTATCHQLADFDQVDCDEQTAAAKPVPAAAPPAAAPPAAPVMSAASLDEQMTAAMAVFAGVRPDRSEEMARIVRRSDRVAYHPGPELEITIEAPCVFALTRRRRFVTTEGMAEIGVPASAYGAYRKGDEIVTKTRIDLRRVESIGVDGSEWLQVITLRGEGMSCIRSFSRNGVDQADRVGCTNRAFGKRFGRESADPAWRDVALARLEEACPKVAAVVRAR